MSPTAAHDALARACPPTPVSGPPATIAIGGTFQRLLSGAPWPAPPLLVCGFFGGPAIIGAITPLRNASTLAAQDQRSNIRQIYGRVFQQGFRGGWVGMRAPMVPATIQFTLLGPGYHVGLGLLGSPSAAVAACALFETMITYGPTTRNAQSAHNANSQAASRVPLRPIFPVGPGFEWLFLRNCVANAGIRVLSQPVTDRLERTVEMISGVKPRPNTYKLVGDLLACMCVGALSGPFNQIYQNQVTSAVALTAGPAERARLGMHFVLNQYTPVGTDGRRRLSRLALRDAGLRSIYVACMFTSFAALERVALGYVKDHDSEATCEALIAVEA